MNMLEKAASTLVSVNIPPADTEIERILHASHNFAIRSGGVLEMMTVPTPAEYKMLRERGQLLLESMHHDRKTIGMLIAQMLNCYANPIKENETAEQVVALYVRELGLDPASPTWAVSQAVGQIRLGQAQGIGFVHRPSTIAVRRVVDSFAYRAKVEMVRIGSVLGGRPAIPQVSPEVRARIAKKFRKFADEMIARQAAREPLDFTADEDRLKAIVGDAAFDALPAAKRRPHSGQIGALVGKRLARA